MTRLNSAVSCPAPEDGPKSQGHVVKLIYQSYLPFQGRYPRVSGQARILKESGFEVTVLGCDRDASHPTEEVLDGIQVARIHVKTAEHRGPLRQVWPLLVFWFKSWRWLRHRGFDVLHCHNLDVLPLGWWVRLWTRRPVVFDSHEPNYYALWPKKWKPFLRLVNGVERWFSRRVDGISVTNDYQVRKYEQMGARRVQLMGNYPLPELSTTELDESKFCKASVTFGRLGTIYRNSGYEESVAALAEVLARFPQAQALLAGRAVDNYYDDFERLIEPIRDRMERIAAFPASQMRELYGRMDVSLLIYPKSDWFREITPRKFFDSVANGVPVIMTDIGGLGAIIEEYQCGYVVDENDTAAIVEAMSVLVQDPAKRREMSCNALQLSQSRFNWRKMADNYVEYQHELMAAANGRR